MFIIRKHGSILKFSLEQCGDRTSLSVHQRLVLFFISVQNSLTTGNKNQFSTGDTSHVETSCVGAGVFNDQEREPQTAH